MLNISFSNTKLGKNVISISRPVGDSCPSSCGYLGNGCYAQKLERIYPQVRNFSSKNMITDANKIYSAIKTALDKGCDLRFHVQGDFAKNDKLDIQYVKDIEKACKMILAKYGHIPYMWAYTHVHSKQLYDKLSPYITLYASVDSDKAKEKAKKAGFKLFAYGAGKFKCNLQNPKKVRMNGEIKQVCPNQLVDVKCETCRICIEGKQDIVFLKH